MPAFHCEILQQNLDLSQMQALVAYSGGLDSHVLLHSLVSLRQFHPQLQIRAVHINHGLSPNAQEWQRHCQQVCRQLQVEYKCIAIDVKGGLAHHSLEAVAREQRYDAFAQELRVGEYLMVAHNEDDQAETVLLQLLRGCGVKGLAAMPVRKKFAAGYLVRPLLQVSRQALQQYAQEQGLVWIEDDSNADLTIARNYLRHKVLPQCSQYWRGTSKVLARTAKFCADAATLMEEVAAQDLSAVAGSSLGTLAVSRLRQLSSLRRSNVLRFWLMQAGLPLPNSKRLQQLQQDFLFSQPDTTPKMTWSGVEIRRFGDDLYAMSPLSAHDPSQIIFWDMTQPLSIPSLDVMITKSAVAGLQVPDQAVVSVRFRQGGERLHPHGRTGSHPLKKLFQEWHVPPWLRERIPLIYVNEELAAVVGYGIAEKFKAIMVSECH